MTLNPKRVDAYIERKGLVCLATDDDWLAIIERVESLYGSNIHHRTERITQQSEPFRRYSATFPDGLGVPYRHIKYLELLLADSPLLQELADWLHSRGIPTQTLLDDPAEAAAFRIFGYVDPKAPVA